MSFDRTPNFTEKLATDPDFRLKVLDEIANDDELKTLTEEDLKAIVGGWLNQHQIQIYGSPYPRDLLLNINIGEFQ
ncbi:MAG: bacteriocin [Microcystis sp. LE18-22.4A]|jgi:bacteriocin-like protein|uniref:bacteriocin n=1 Tax=Microcystis sp. LE18-22.4A TaxID=3016432 RepID=UPI0022CA4D32|nr:bacteriocin [Microcystis sp. LE18-22.4A]MCZ8121436.1 bacteriocin [Microcystis sp. LE18-22.4A]